MARKGTKAAETEQGTAAAGAGETKDVARAQQEAQGAVETTGETDWEPADPDWVREDYGQYEEDAEERRRAGAVVKPPEGKSTWRVLPPIRGTRRLWYRVWTHSVNNERLNDATRILAALPEDAKKQISDELGVMDIEASSLGKGFKATVCLSKMNDEPCFTCKLVSVLFKIARASAALKSAEFIAKDLSSKEEIFMNAVRLDKPEEMERGPRGLQVTMTLFEKINRIFAQPETDEQLGGDFSHPETGFNLVIDRTVDQKNKVKIGDKMVDKTTYEVSPGRARTKLANMGWLKQMHDLTKFRDMPDDTAMRGIVEGSGERPAVDGPNDPYAAAPANRQLPPASGGKEEDWIEVDGVWGYRRDHRAAGRRV